MEEVFGRMTRDFPPEYGDLPEFIKCCRTMSEAEGEYSEDEFFYFVATSVETLAEDKIDELFESKYSGPLEEIRVKEGLEENQYWKADDSSAPDEYRRLLDEFREAKREILSKSFQEFGENQTGTLIEEDYDEYRRRKENGKAAFYSRHKFEAVRMEASEMDLSLSSDEPDGVHSDVENQGID